MQSSRAKGFAGITVAALTAAALVAGPAAAADTTIYSCIDKKSGNARLVTKSGQPLTAATVCDGNEYSTKIFWNQTGPTGATGATGPQGRHRGYRRHRRDWSRRRDRR